MCSQSITNEFSTFHAQYAVQLLRSLGSLFDEHYLTNEKLRSSMHDLAKRDDKCFYQLALHAYRQLQINHSFDFNSVFQEERFDAMKDFLKEDQENSNKKKTYYVPTVHVTPTSIRLMPLERTEGHRALRHQAFNRIHNFCLVYFKPDPPAKYVNKCDRYKRIFQSGIEICHIRYHLFGLSNSQQREHSYWFIRATSLDEIHQKRQLLGDFSSITNIGKYVARVGLWFSKSDPTGIELNYISDRGDFDWRIEQGQMCVTMLDDIERNQYCFTDGNGLISKGLARLISERLNYIVKYEQNEIYPSAYQIRMAGCKGLVIIDPESTLSQYYMKIRPSMQKFQCDDWTLEICETSQPVPTRLNGQIITIMSDLGVPNSTFLDLQEKWFRNKTQPPHSTQDLLKNKIPLPVNECRYMFGCALESRLEPGQCFVRYQVVDDNGKPFEEPKFETVIGQIIITKNPCPYAGDMMQLQAVDIPELHCLKDVIVFSTKGDRPDCHKIAGSDLDGDHYFVYWGEQLQFLEIIEPLEYKPQSTSICSKCITPQDLINYCLSSLGATSYGEIYNLHAIIVDQNREKNERRTCQKLAIEMADMFSAAIDAGKTGYRVDQGRIKEIRKIAGWVYPDFLMKKTSYPSRSILGILYRRAVDFKEQNSRLFQEEDIHDAISSSTKTNERSLRFYMKTRMALKIDLKTIHEELQSVYGDQIPSMITIEKWAHHHHSKKRTNETSAVEEINSRTDSNLSLTNGGTVIDDSIKSTDQL